MAIEAAKTLFFFSLLSICSSGSLVGFSYDARRGSAASSPKETISFLKKNGVLPSQIRVLVADHRSFDSLSDTGISVDLYMNETGIERLQKSKASAVSWVVNHLRIFLPHTKINSILVDSSKLVANNQLHLLLPILSSIHSALKSFDLDGHVKVLAVFPLSMLENSDKIRENELRRIIDFVRKCQSFIILETSIDGELSLGDQFIRLMAERAAAASKVLTYADIPLVLNVRSSAVPSAVEVTEFTAKMTRSVEKHAQIMDRICGLFVDITPMGKSEQKELKREEEQIFPSSHRELVDDNNFNSAFKTTVHDTIMSPTTFTPAAPITNPDAAPVTVPSTNPTPAVITVPANPVTILPMNPVSNPSLTPITVPVSPITVPSTIPVPPPPVTVPVTNPVTAPITVPTTPPVTNPVTTYPVPPPGSTPITTPTPTPVTVPMAPPATTISPTVSGQSWCVAKTGTLDKALQDALDYACGIGGADCSAIQQTGSCYNPNTLHDHASYAFNSYYQKNPSTSSCDFGGTATLVNTNPSTGSCVFLASSSSASPSTTSTPPPSTPTTSTSPVPPAFSSPTAPNSPSSSVLNTNNATTDMFGMPPPADPSGNSVIILDHVQLAFALALSLATTLIMAEHLMQG